MLSAAIIKITRLSTPMSVLTSASERLGRAASGSFLRSGAGGCGFCGCCDCGSDCLGCCADLFEVCGWGSCAATPRPTAISSGRAVKTNLFIFNSFSERRGGGARVGAGIPARVCDQRACGGEYPLLRGRAELRTSVLIGLRSVIIAYRFEHVASPYS